MRTSEETIRKIEEFEGMRLKAYRCPAGMWTIGIGHTSGVKEGMTVTKEEALRLLREDLSPIEKHVSGYGLELTQAQFDSLVDFAFNVGTAALDGSTLLKKLKARAPAEEIRKELSRWVYAKGRKLQGLVERRRWEARAWERTV